MNTKIKPIKYFHPSGRDLPNGSHYQKGGFLAECRRNANAFAFKDDLCGIILFPVSANASGLNGDAIALMLRQTETTAAYSVGNFFTGRYVATDAEIYDSTSLCIAVNGLSGRPLLKLAETLATSLNQKSFLLKDMNKFYLNL